MTDEYKMPTALPKVESFATNSTTPLPRAIAVREYQELQRARKELEEWRTWGIAEIAVRNPNVAEYCKHWEMKAANADAEVAKLRTEIAEMRTYSYETVRGAVDWRDKEIAALKEQAVALCASHAELVKAREDCLASLREYFDATSAALENAKKATGTT